MSIVSTADIRAPRPVTPASILAELLVDLVKRLDEVDESWRTQLRQAAALAQGLDPYLSRWTTPESSALRVLAERTRSADWSEAGIGVGRLEQEMLSGHVEGQFLKMLVHATGATSVLDIGMFTGYSALAMAEALPATGRVIACELDAAVAEFASAGFAQSADGHKIEVRVGPGLRTLAELAATGAVFELVFIDADKAGYRDYLNALLDTDLLAPHGLICVDNTLLQGEPWSSDRPSTNGSAIAMFNRAVADDARVEQVILPLRDGFTMIRRVDGERPGAEQRVVDHGHV